MEPLEERINEADCVQGRNLTGTSLAHSSPRGARIAEVRNSVKSLEVFQPGVWSLFVIEPLDVGNSHWAIALIGHVGKWPEQHLEVLACLVGGKP